MRFVRLLAVAVAISAPLCAETQLGVPSRIVSVSRPMIRNSRIIFSGTALKVEHFKPTGSPGITQITFRVESAIRGVRQGQIVKVREWEGLWSAGERYRAGEHVLLFLYPNSKLGLTSPVGGALGRYQVDQTGRVLVKGISGVRPEPVNLRSFIRALRRRKEDYGMRTVSMLIIVIAYGVLVPVVWAGGPEYVAGASFFDPSVKGTPLTWANGTVMYYTDQGNLSGILPQASADDFVATAFNQWTSIPTATVASMHAGQLAEDVSSANVTLVNGGLSLPPDILPSATANRVAIVYDTDGSVTDALLGAGASNATFCASDGVFGGIDNFLSSAQFVHALIVLNGNCAANPRSFLTCNITCPYDRPGAGTRLVASQSERNHTQSPAERQRLRWISCDA